MDAHQLEYIAWAIAYIEAHLTEKLDLDAVAKAVGYGNKNTTQQKSVFSISIRFILAASFAIFILSMSSGPAIIRLFVKETSAVYQIAVEGFAIFACSFLFCGLNIFTCAMFTALSNGKVSAVLSFLRTFGLLAGGILLLPQLCGVPGVWLAVPVAESVMSVISAACLVHHRKRYGY